VVAVVGKALVNAITLLKVTGKVLKSTAAPKVGGAGVTHGWDGGGVTCCGCAPAGPGNAI
jgi:hypothetical protein